MVKAFPALVYSPSYVFLPPCFIVRNDNNFIFYLFVCFYFVNFFSTRVFNVDAGVAVYDYNKNVFL